MREFDFRNLVEVVREHTDILDVVRARITLDRHNKALCPFHDEKSASFSVNPKGQYFHCFGCNVGGDVFRFVELFENKSFMEALAELATQAGIPLVEPTREQRQGVEEVRVIETILSDAAQFYHLRLTPEVQSYLKGERGFSDETISSFQIGHANGKLSEYLIDERRHSLELCLEAGILRVKDGGGVTDYFTGHIVFPHLKRGRIVNLTGRNLNGKGPKYLHLPGEMRYLYNEDAVSSRTVIITEGIPDCLSAVQAGFPAVAILGSSNFKPEYLPKLARCETIYLCLDGDDAGLKGTIKIGTLIGERARIISLPEGLDLNDYLRSHSKDDFQSLIRSSQDTLKFELNLIPPETDKTELPHRLDPILRKLALMDKVKAEAYLSYSIKSRFKLKKQDTDGYRELVNRYRQGEAQVPNIQTTLSVSEPCYSAHFDGLVDLVNHNGSVAFLVKDNASLAVFPEVVREGVRYVPPPQEQIPWLLPKSEEVLRYYHEPDSALYDDLLKYHKTISELPGEEYFDLIVAWDFHTYLRETVQYSPMICLFAVPERGKSRTGKGMIYVAYRGIHVESLREAYLLRVAHNLHASLFIDVIDVWHKAEKNNSEDILLHRFEKGAKVPRVLYPERGAHLDTVYYSIFGPTLISTNEGVHRILETRAIQLNMPETRKRFENDVTPELALPLRERLTAFRARHISEVLHDIPKPAAGRLGDILKPLQQVIRLAKPVREPAFLQLVGQIESERLMEKADCLEAQILRIVDELGDEVVNGILPVKKITDTYNTGKSDRSQITYHKVGRRLSAMGFKKAKTGDGASAIMWDEEGIGRMKETYGLTTTSETSERSGLATGISEVSDDTDVSQYPF